MTGMLVGWLAVGLVTAAGPTAGPERRPPNKYALFGDPTLVPTRAGERARAELAAEADVRAVLAALTESADWTVAVRWPTGDDPGAVVIAGPAVVASDQVARIAEAVLGPWSRGQVVVETFASSPTPAEPTDAPALPWLLAVALVGLGASAGIVHERVRRRRSRMTS